MLDRIALITGNAGKAAEYAAMLGIEVTPAKAELTEVQSLDVAVVAARKAADAYAQLGEPVLVDDTGLTVHAWNGLPGALVAWFLDTVGAQGILDMAAGLTDRSATVTTALGYADADGVRVFTGNRERLPRRRTPRHVRLRLRRHLHPRHRQQRPHLRADDQRGKEQDLPPQPRSRSNARRTGTSLTTSSRAGTRCGRCAASRRPGRPGLHGGGTRAAIRRSRAGCTPMMVIAPPPLRLPGKLGPVRQVQVLRVIGIADERLRGHDELGLARTPARFLFDLARRRRRYRRFLLCPCPGAVHRLDAAGDLRRRQGDRDAARGAAPGHRQGRRTAGPDADPADRRGETQPQADGHPGLRLRCRAVPTQPARRHHGSHPGRAGQGAPAAGPRVPTSSLASRGADSR